MIQASLQDFCNRMVAKGTITRDDVNELIREILPEGLACRDEADMLIGLDRAVRGADPAFEDVLTAVLVDFAVWGERPTGHIDAEIAHWLAGSLSVGGSPTPLGTRIAREVIREAQSSHELLLACALGGSACIPAATRRLAA